MNFRLFYILGILLAQAFALYAQEPIVLEGKITNQNLDGSSIQIINLSLGRGTITNEEGKFTIPARLNDTLYIIALQFKELEVVVDQKLMDSGKLDILLDEQVNELDAVNISDINLSGLLGMDARTIAVKKEFNETDVGFALADRTIRSSELRQLQSSGGFGLTGLISVLSGQRKKLKKIYAISVKEGRVKKAQAQFERSFYIDQLHIPEDLIPDFCYYVYENNAQHLHLAESGEQLELVTLLRRLAPEYLEFKKSEKR